MFDVPSLAMIFAVSAASSFQHVSAKCSAMVPYKYMHVRLRIIAV